MEPAILWGGRLPSAETQFCGAAWSRGCRLHPFGIPPQPRGLLSLGVPGLPASGLSQRSSSSSGSSGRTAGTGTVPPCPAPMGMPLPGQACPASRSCPDPTETGRGPRAAFWGSLPPAPGKQTLALKEGPKRPPLSSQVSLLQDLGLAPRPMRLGRLASRAPPCCRLSPILPPREGPGTAPWHRASSSSSSSAQPCPAPGPTSAAPSLYKACGSTAAGLRVPPPAWLPPGAPRGYRVTCFDCLTCNC